MTSEIKSIHPKIAAFLQDPVPLFINGEWHESSNDNLFETRNPATEEILAHVHEASQADVNCAVQAAAEAFEKGPWPAMKETERAKLMYTLADLMERDFDMLAQLDTMDNGKSIHDMTGNDLPSAIDNVRYFAGWTTKNTGQTIPVSSSSLNYTRHEPVGVVGQIIPWNFPIMMALWKIAPAIATGCTVVLKPAEQTPLSAMYLAKLIQEAGFPKGVINIVNGKGKTTGDTLIKHPKVDKIAFTGSTRTGQLIMKEAANSMKRITLELGGKSPNIILPDADLEKAIPGVFNGIMANQGEVCCAGSRVFIPEEIFEKVITKLKSYAENMKLGNGLHAETEMGPLVSKQQFDLVTSYIKQGQEEGATLITGGETKEQGYFVSPSIFTDTTDDMSIVQEEIFGPVVVAIPYKTVDEGIDRANNSPDGLAAGIWTENLKYAHKIAARRKAGSIWINTYNVTDAAVPFGGFKQAGF